MSGRRGEWMIAFLFAACDRGGLPARSDGGAPATDAAVVDQGRDLGSILGCSDGTAFCNSACGICLPTGQPCRIDSCGPDGRGGTACGGARCGSGTRCTDGVCVADPTAARGLSCGSAGTCAADQFCIVATVGHSTSAHCQAQTGCGAAPTCACLTGAASQVLECYGNPGCAVDGTGIIHCDR